MTTRPVPIFTDGDASGAVRVWRAGGAVCATVVVKACFSLVQGRPAALAASEPVILEDRTFGGHPMRSVERASEAAPYLARCDIVLTGHAHAPGGRPSTSARLAVYRDRTPLVDKTIHVFGDRKSGAAPQPFERMALVYERAFGGPGVEANPVGSQTPNLVDPKDAQRAACFAPISRFWPSRKKLLAGRDPAMFAEAVWALPESFPWDYFQAAPADQQAAFLAGDEWIVLDGMHPQLPRLQTRLPGAVGAARVVTPAGESPVALCADMLIIDAERGIGAVVWRGRTMVAGGEQALSSMAVAAGVEMSGKPIGWASLVANARQSIARNAVELDATMPGFPAPKPAAPVGESTLGMSDAQQAAQPLRAVAPFQVSAAAPAAKDVSATPWGAPMAPVMVAVANAGEETLAVGAATVKAVIVDPPPVTANLPLPATANLPLPVTANLPQVGASPPQPSNVAREKPRPPPPAAEPPQRRAPLSLEERLRAAGTPADEIAQLLAALAPPVPPPPDEEPL